MSTGGLAIAIAETPHKFKGLHTIGLIIFIFNIVLFLIFSTCMTTRCILYPSHVKQALIHPSESFFIGSFWLSISVIIGGIQVYGITYGPAYPFLIPAVYVLYWMYAACSLANSIAQYYVLIRWSAVRPVPFTPPMFLAGYSAMLTGSIASLVAPFQPPPRAVVVLFSGLAFKGFGIMISFVCIGFFVHFLLEKGLPPPQLRPALFIPVGSIAYTIVALIGLADAIPSYGYFAAHPTAKETLKIMALFVSVFMWLFAFWFFCIAFLANISCIGKMPFGLSWWAFIFPNVGFMLATEMMGKELDSAPILWVASGMTVGVVGIWIVAVVGCVRAVWKGRIVWPGRDEDKDL
ncbi:C4-dicarboxylate transporter/malic acid transport protein [Ophiobolus disseminans]|uniref:C4-dicarboxylate transporter/malic acid transport protein n=1 Tax=Ophiobolus disseminans TaxID=1469910 RepID=A0A6A7AJA0_9PLEO|nr:C4-dicarboxylate transporter/malic acid transport protein [Ophiobolus disseminans]